MDINSYHFDKKLLLRESNKPNLVPEELKEIVEWLKNKGFILHIVENPQTMPYRKEIIYGSYFIELELDLGEEKRQLLEVQIYKNQWTDWKDKYCFRILDDEIQDNTISERNDFDRLKKDVLLYFRLIGEDKNKNQNK